MTAPRIVARGATYGITRRCILRKLLLTPLTPVVHQGILYALALAQQRARVLMHGEVLMPNHVHLAVTPTEDNLPEFLRLFFGESSKFLKVALAEHGFEPPENIWSAGRPHVMRLVDQGAQLTWLHYLAANPVDAGLVERVDEYPGHVSDPALMRGGRIAVARPPFYFDRRAHPRELTLCFSLPPLLRQAFGGAEPVVYHLRRTLAATERACRRRAGPVLGPLRISRQHPWSEPRSPRTFSPAVPTFMVKGSTELRVRCALETRAFRDRHEACRRARLRGDDPEFPYGTYAMRVWHRARVQDPSTLGSAAINAPGRLDSTQPPLEAHKRSALTSALRQAAAHPTDAADTLAQRMLDGQSDQTDRSNGPMPIIAADGPSDTNPSEPAPTPKHVVLRSSTQSARRRRRHIQAQRPRVDDLEVDPPPD